MLKLAKPVSRFVHDYLVKTGKKRENKVWGANYRWEHTLRVAHWARILALGEKADIEQCVVAALFHDVSHFISEDYRKHGTKSAEIAKEFLKSEGVPEAFINEVCYAIESHVGERNPKTMEAKILQDADTIDRFGYFRILMFGKTTDLSNLKSLTQELRAFLGYLKKLEQGQFGPMWTKLAQTKVSVQMETYTIIYTGLLEEIENTQLL
ncbi:MAG: HD domain-containing protein [Candidatus Bathyarchaeota archaeon]|nr:MAG: HD domain-containing protein [Candidatus Bathyarchaeota archaeon]